MTCPSDSQHETDVLTVVTGLELYHGRPLPREARVYYVQALSRYSPAVLTDAASRWKHQNSPATRFPSLSQLRACIDDARSRTWARSKNAENRQPLSQPTVTADPAYHRACWALIRKAKDMSRSQLADAFDVHHRQWPGHDWDGAAKRLRGCL